MKIFLYSVSVASLRFLLCEAWAGTVDSSKFHVLHLSLFPGFHLFFFDFVRSISLVSYTPSPEPSKLYL